MATQSFLNFLKPQLPQMAQTAQPAAPPPPPASNPFRGKSNPLAGLGGGSGNPFSGLTAGSGGLGGSRPSGGAGTGYVTGDALAKTPYGGSYDPNAWSGVPNAYWPTAENGGWDYDPNFGGILSSISRQDALGVPMNAGGEAYIDYQLNRDRGSMAPGMGSTGEMQEVIDSFGTLNISNQDFYNTLKTSPGMTLDQFAAANGITAPSNRSWVIRMYNKAMGMPPGGQPGAGAVPGGPGVAGGPDITGFADPSGLQNVMSAGAAYDPANKGQGGFAGGQGGKQNPGLGKNNKVKIRKAGGGGGGGQGGGGGNPNKGNELANPAPPRIQSNNNNNNKNKGGGKKGKK